MFQATTNEFSSHSVTYHIVPSSSKAHNCVYLNTTTLLALTSWNMVRRMHLFGRCDTQPVTTTYPATCHIWNSSNPVKLQPVTHLFVCCMICSTPLQLKKAHLEPKHITPLNKMHYVNVTLVNLPNQYLDEIMNLSIPSLFTCLMHAETAREETHPFTVTH